MTSINDLMPSRFLKKENVIPDVQVTIAQVLRENIAKDNDPEDMKAVVYFKEFTQGLLLNIINKETLILIFGTDRIEDWIGKPITLFNDPSVSLNGKLVGGVRIRIPQGTMNNLYPGAQETATPDRAVNPSTAQAYDPQGNPIY